MVNIVPKGSPDTSRQALLEAFVGAHFDGETGAPLCDLSGFYSVLARLGRKDLDFGVEARALGALNEDEKKRAQKMHSLLRKEAPKQRKGELSALNRDHMRSSPFYQQLSTAQRLVFEALDISGTRVIQPAVATTLAQAILEGWFDVPHLSVSAADLLKQSSEQGDAHAAYLLATVRTPEGAYLDESEDKQQSFLEHAKRQGHEGADDALQEEARRDEDWAALEEESRDSTVEYELDQCKRQIQHALEVGPHSEGNPLYKIAIQLDEANRSYVACCTQDRFDRSTYRSHREQVLEWMEKAAKASALACHWIASDRLSMYGKAADRLSWLKRAAQPESGVEPFHPALVDMAEICADRGEAVFDLVEARKCLAQAIENIAAPGAEIAIRMADLDEQLNEGQSFSMALELYAGASKSSAYAAFRAGLLALRMASSDEEFEASLSHFKDCLLSKSGSWDTRNRKSQRYAKVVMAIGWGGWEDGDEAWDEATVFLVQQLHEQGYLPDLESVWLRETDIQKLFFSNPQYVTYKEWVQGGLANEKLREEFGEEFLVEHRKEFLDSLLKFLENRHYAFGACDPLSFLKGIVAVSTRKDVSVVQLKRDYQMDRQFMLSEFLLGQLYLNGRLGENMEVVALGHFEKARDLISQWQHKSGGQGVGSRADSLRWLEENTLEGMMNSQPSVRRMVFKNDLDGPANNFGNALMRRILALVDKNQLPGAGVAIRVRYRDRYINTPFKVALLAHWMAALRTHLEGSSRWQVKKVEVETEEMAYTWGKVPINQVWLAEKGARGYPVKIATKDRDDVLTQTLAHFGIAVEIPKVSTQHDRELTVTFDDGCELQVDLGQGLSHWTAVGHWDELNFSFDHRNSIKDQVAQLTDCKVRVGSEKGVSSGFVEWRQARSRG